MEKNSITVRVYYFILRCCHFMYRNCFTISGILYPLWTTLDSELGWSFRPKLRAICPRGAADVIINSAGFSAPEFDPNKPLDHLRIAIVGDRLLRHSKLNMSNIAKIARMTSELFAVKISIRRHSPVRRERI